MISLAIGESRPIVRSFSTDPAGDKPERGTKLIIRNRPSGGVGEPLRQHDGGDGMNELRQAARARVAGHAAGEIGGTDFRERIRTRERPGGNLQFACIGGTFQKSRGDPSGDADIRRDISVPWGTVGRAGPIVVARKLQHTDSELAHIMQTLGLLPRPLHALKSRKRQRGKDGNDGNDHQQLDQGKRIEKPAARIGEKHPERRPYQPGGLK